MQYNETVLLKNNNTLKRLKSLLEPSETLNTKLHDDYKQKLNELINKRKQYQHELLQNKDTLEVKLFQIERLKCGFPEEYARQVIQRCKFAFADSFEQIEMSLGETITIEPEPFWESAPKRIVYYQRDYTEVTLSPHYGWFDSKRDDKYICFPVCINKNKKFFHETFKDDWVVDGKYEVKANTTIEVIAWTENYLVRHCAIKHSSKWELLLTNLQTGVTNKLNTFNHYNCGYVDDRLNLCLFIHGDLNHHWVDIWDLKKPNKELKSWNAPGENIPKCATFLENGRFVAIAFRCCKGVKVTMVSAPMHRKNIFNTIKEIDEMVTTHDNCLVMLSGTTIYIGNVLNQILRTFDNMPVSLGRLQRTLFIGTDNRILAVDYKEEKIHVI